MTVCRKTLLPLQDRIRSHARIHLPRVIRSGEALEHAEAHGRTPASRDERYFDVSYYPVRTPGVPSFSVAAIVYEVTERRRAEAEREALLQAADRARRETERASRAKDEFLAVLSHGCARRCRACWAG